MRKFLQFFLNSGFEKTLKLLIQNEANVNSVTNMDDTALILATSKGIIF